MKNFDTADFLAKIKDIQGKEAVYWLVLLLNLTMLIINLAAGSMMFLVSLGAVTIMTLVLWSYYTLEKR